MTFSNPPQTDASRWFRLLRHPDRRAASVSLSRWEIALLAFGLLLIAALPIVTDPLPPLEDYLNHLARMHIIEAMGRDPDLSRFYEIDWALVPNLLMDLTVPTLARYLNIFVAGQAFLILIFTLVVTGALALHRALFGRWSAVPLAVMPFLYNYVFLVGVANYQAGVGLALWGLAFWVMARDRSLAVGLVVSAGFVLLLYVTHLSALGVYGLGLLAFETWQLLSSPRDRLRRRILVFVSAGLPFLCAVPLLISSPTWSQVSDYSWEETGKIDGLLYAVEAYSETVALILGVAFAAAGTWAWRRKLLTAHPMLIVLLVLGGVVYYALPRTLFGTYMADQRVPVAILFMALACIELNMITPRARQGFMGLIALALIVRVIEINVTWGQLSPELFEFRDSVRKIPRGSRVLVAYADQAGGDATDQLGLVHAASLATLERSALVTTLFTVQGKQVLHARPEYRTQVDTNDDSPPMIDTLLLDALQAGPPADAYWTGWLEKYDYVYLLFTKDDTENPDPKLLTLAQDETRFQLYKINRQ